MCTKQETKEAIHEYMTAKNEDGQNVIEHEMQEVVNKTIAVLTMKFGFALLSVVVAVTIAWFEVKHDVKANTDARTVGDRYTQEEHDVFEEDIRRQLANLRDDYKEDIADIKDDIRFIREKLE